MIYFIREMGFGLIKIGNSRFPEERMKQLQTGQPYEFVLAATAPGGFYAERGYHIQFAEHRFRGEWFYPRGELAALDQGAPVLRCHLIAPPSVRMKLIDARVRAMRATGQDRYFTKNDLVAIGFWPPPPEHHPGFPDTAWLRDERA